MQAKIIRILGPALLLIAATQSVRAQTFDTTGTAGLSGPYLFRYVVYGTDQNAGITEGCSVSGVITFDGKGTYATSNVQLYDSAGSSAGSCSNPTNGTYGVQSN